MANDIWTAPSGPSAGTIGLSEMQQQRTDNINVLGLAVDGDLSTTPIKHRHLTGTLAARPAAGEAGRVYYATDLGVAFLDDGSNWVVLSHDSRICDRFYDEFAKQISTGLGTSGWIAGWRVTFGTSDGNASCANAAHSYLEIATGATVNSTAHVTPRGNDVALLDPANCLPLIWAAVLKFDNNATVSYHVGVVDGLSVAATPVPSTSAMFRVIDSGNFITVTQNNGGGETTNDTGVAPDNAGLDHLMIVIYSASKAEFYINGTKTGVDHTAGIPQNENLHPGFGIKTTAADTRKIRLDMNDLLFKRYYP